MTTYRDLVDELIKMPRIRDTLDLDSIPAHSTLCKAFDPLEMAVLRVLLNVSLADLPVTGSPVSMRPMLSVSAHQKLFGGLSMACDFADLVQNGFCTRPVAPLQGAFGSRSCTSPAVSRRNIHPPNSFSIHYAKRTNLTVQQLKTTLLVDTATNAVLDIHVTTTRKHDTQIAPQVVKRNAASIAVLIGDKGYDNQ